MSDGEVDHARERLNEIVLAEGEKDWTVQLSPTLAKFHQAEKTCCALSHSRWVVLSSANRGVQQPLLVVKSTNELFCQNAIYCF